MNGTAPRERAGFGKHTPGDQRMIGELVLAARRERIPPKRWKDLEVEFQRSRWTLQRYAKLVSAQESST